MELQVTDALSEAQSADWLAFLATADHGHPEQDPRFAEGWQAQGHDILYAMGRVEGELRAVAMFDIARGSGVAGFFPTASAVSGPVCDNPQDMLTFLDMVERHEAFRHALKLRVTPYWLGTRATELSEVFAEAGWAPFEEAYLRSTGIHDATGTAEDIAARFNKSARRKLRKARAFGLEIDYVSDEVTALEAFRVYDGHFQARYGDTIDQQAFMADFRNAYAAGDLGALFVVRHEGDIVAGCIVHRNHDTVFLRHSFIDDEAVARLGNIRIAPLITVEGLKWGNAHGCRYADENGYIHGLDESHPLYRVYKYKEEFHPTEVQRLPGHQKVLRPAIDKGVELAEQAEVAVKPLVRALRKPLRGRPSRADAESRAEAALAAVDTRAWRRIGRAKVPIGLTIGGAAVWLLSSLAV